MDLHQAMVQVSEIRDHLARTEMFRGYRSITVGFSGVVGLTAATVQALWLPRPTERIAAYLTLWIGAAAINLIVVCFEIWSRTRIARMFHTRRTTIFAIEQFLPSLVVGGIVTLVLVIRSTESVWMLPGLWALLFSLGVFASRQVLPRAVAIAGAWYMIVGALILIWGKGEAALSPWYMGITFGVGQLLTALILHFTLERDLERQD